MTKIYHKEIIPGKSQALKIDDHDVVLINVYDPNNDDASCFEILYDFLGANNEEEYTIGGVYNSIINSNLDEFGDIKGMYQNSRDRIIANMNSFDLADVCNPNLRQ